MILINGIVRVRDGGASLETSRSSHQDSHVSAFNFNPQSAEQTEIINAFLISKGAVTNGAFQLEIHGTRAASGKITVEFEKMRIVCRGR